MKSELELFIRDRRTFVPPSGPLECKLACVGEQPGRVETVRKKVFIGPAGGLLDGCFQSAGVYRSECYLTNVIKDLDVPLKSYIISPSKSGQTPKVLPMGENYINILKDELSKCSANVILAIGNIALFALTNRWGITSWRGSVLESTLLPGRKVIPVIHPATYTEEKLWKNPKAYLNKHLIIMDLRRALKESEFPDIRRKDRKLIIKPSFRETLAFLDQCKHVGYAKGIIDYDIEITNMELSCISFATSPQMVMSIPFTAPGGDYFPPDQEAQIMIQIATIMRDKKISKRGQYIIFDSHFLLRKYGIRTHNLHDTMVAQKILYPDFLVGLDFITAMWTDIPYYKKDGKFWLKGIGTFEQGWIYNAYDSIACADAHPQQMRELVNQGNIKTYERQMKLIPPLTYMMEHGIRIDIEGMKSAARDCGSKIEELNEDLCREVGRTINPNSPQQLIQYFYIEKGLPTYRKAGSPTTDVDAMKRIARKGYKEASIILQIRRVIKRKSTYLDLTKVDSDNRMRCSYNPVGTRYSRISSSENIFGTGMNLQNIPHDILQYFLADEGYVYYNLDLSQFENRIVAYVGNIPQMIDAFESGKDVHRLTAAMLFDKHPNEVTIKDGTCSLGDGTHSERFFGKKANHELNYGMGYKAFSLMLEILERDGKRLVTKYHNAYPGVRNSYQTYVKSQLAENRTLTNLMERKTIFLGQWGDKLFREAYSCIPQGTCGDVINERGVNYIYYNQQWFRPIELLNQVHDSIGLQIPLTLPLLQHAEMLIRIKKNLETPLEWKGRSFVIPVDLTIGFNMYLEEGVEVKGEKFSENPTELAVTIQKAINKLKED